jgi:hypothetical protein
MIKIIISVFKAYTSYIFGYSDVTTWSKIKNLRPEWEERTAIAAKFLPTHSSILEFGAGTMALRKHLPEGCSYIPSDLVKRGPDTIICDLNNNDLQKLPKVDVTVFLGVLEYVNNLRRILPILKSNCKMVVCSYATLDDRNLIRILKRRANGWVNDYSDKEIRKLFQENGFELGVTVQYKDQIIYRFELHK